MRTFNVVRKDPDMPPTNISGHADWVDWAADPLDVLKQIDNLLRKHKLRIAVGKEEADGYFVQVETLKRQTKRR